MRKIFGIAVLAAMIVVGAYAVYRSAVYRQCATDTATQFNYQQQYGRYAALMIHIDCLGPFAHENHGPIVAVFTIVLAFSTILLWLSTRNAALAAKTAAEHIPLVERGYIIGGGPWPTDDPDYGAVSLGNYGKTPAILKKVEWAFCDKSIFPENGVVSKLLANKRFRKLLESKRISVKTLEKEDNIRPGAGPGAWVGTKFKFSDAAGKIFFGKFTYSILFDSDEHFSTFKLQMSADGRDSVGLPGSYSDWN
jgi:hypothetical protein